MYRKHLRARRLFANNTVLARLPFMLAVILGGTILSIMKLKYFNIDQIYVSLAAVSFIIIYALTVMLIPALRIREDQLGDNCYYLGFLYTLGSLVWALNSFKTSFDVNEIIANFGLALFSTIFGIILRVVINQSRKDILETERECRIELASAVSRMRANIDEATYSLESFCNLTQQLVRDTTNEAAAVCVKSIEACTQSLALINEKVLTSINHSLENHEQYTNQLNRAMMQIENEMYSIAKRLSGLEIDKQVIHAKVNPAAVDIGESLYGLVHTIKDHNAALAHEISRTKNMTVEFADSLSDVINMIASRVK